MIVSRIDLDPKALTFSQVVTLLNIKKGNKLTTDSVSIDPSLFGARIDHLVAFIVPKQAPLIIEHAKVEDLDFEQKKVAISGVTSIFHLSSQSIKAEFWMDADQAWQWRLSLALAANWKFSDCLPDLSKVYDNASRDLLPGEDIIRLDRQIFDNALFVITSEARPKNHEAFNVPLVQGINFIGQVHSEVFDWLDPLFHHTGPLTVYGSVHFPEEEPEAYKKQHSGENEMPLYPWESSDEQKATLPGILLQINIPLETSIQGIFSFKGEKIYVYMPLSEDWVMEETNPSLVPSVGYAGTATVQDMVIKTTLEIPLRNKTLHLLAKASGVTLGHISKLSSISGTKITLLNHLPEVLKEPLDKLGKLELIAFEVDFDYKNGIEVRQITSFVACPGIELFLLGDKLMLEQVKLSFIIDNPFAANDRDKHIFTEVFGRVEIDGILFGVYCSSQNGYLFNLHTLKDFALPVSTFIQHFGTVHAYFPDGLVVNNLCATVYPGKSCAFELQMANDPQPWSLMVGVAKLPVSNVFINVEYAGGGSISGTVGGKIRLGNLTAFIEYDYPGDVLIKSTLPEITFQEIIEQFIPDAKKLLPEKFDLTFSDSPVLFRKNADAYTFQLASNINKDNTVVVEVKKTASGWGMVFGLAMESLHLSSIPGLSALEYFDAFKLSKPLMVFSTFNEDDFHFPDLSQFDASAFSDKTMALPGGASELVPGFNTYATWELDLSNSAQKLIKQFLNLQGQSVDAVLQFGKAPSEFSKLAALYDGHIMGHKANLSYGGQLKNEEASAFISGSIDFVIQGSTQKFTVVSTFFPQGAFLSGTMTGSAAVDLGAFKVANLALAIGINPAGIPSLGIAGTLDVKDIESAVAVFFDSTDPSKSMVAGAISDVSLRAIIEAFAGNIQGDVDAVFEKIKLQGIHTFTIPADLSNDLDNRDLTKIGSICSARGNLDIPQDLGKVLLVTNEKGKRWYLTDMTTMKHYSFVLQNGEISVSTQAQFYFAPQDTSIGALTFPQGIFLNGRLIIPGFTCEAEIEVHRNQGIFAEAEASPLVILDKNLFSFTGIDGTAGPSVSLCSYQKGPIPPHCKVMGKLTVLGLGEVTDIDISQEGGRFRIENSSPVAKTSLSGCFQDTDKLKLEGEINFGAPSLNLGILGTVTPETDIMCKLNIEANGSDVKSTLTVGFKLIETFEFSLSVDVRGQKINDFLELIKTELGNRLLGDVSKYLNMLKKGIIAGVANVGVVLKDGFKLAADKTAEVLKGAGYTVDAVGGFIKNAYGLGDQAMANVLKGAGYTVGEVGGFIKNAYGLGDQAMANVLKGAGYTVDEVGGFIKNAYGLGDQALANVLNGAGYAVDEVAGFFKRIHIKVDIWIVPHADFNSPPPHGDGNLHVDTPAGPHVDGKIWPTKKHADFNSPPPHGDANPHIDTPAGPHVDTGTHIDT